MKECYDYIMMNYMMWGSNFWNMPFASPFIVSIALLDIVLKGFALWKAAKNNQMYWFLALLFINSAGILPVVYLLLNAQKKPRYVS